MKNKLKLILWGKHLELPEDYDNLEFDRYKLKIIHNIYGYELKIYKNNKIIKEIWYHKNGKLWHDYNFKNGKLDGKQYGWWTGGMKMENYILNIIIKMEK